MFVSLPIFCRDETVRTVYCSDKSIDGVIISKDGIGAAPSLARPAIPDNIKRIKAAVVGIDKIATFACGSVGFAMQVSNDIYSMTSFQCPAFWSSFCHIDSYSGLMVVGNVSHKKRMLIDFPVEHPAHTDKVFLPVTGQRI